MLLHVSDPAHTSRLAAFLAGLDHDTQVVGPDHVEVTRPAGGDEHHELELKIYLRVWRSLYPDAEVTLVAG